MVAAAAAAVVAVAVGITDAGSPRREQRRDFAPGHCTMST